MEIKTNKKKETIPNSVYFTKDTKSEFSVAGEQGEELELHCRKGIIE